MGSLTLNTTNGAINLVPADGSGTQTLNIGRQPNLGKVLQVIESPLQNNGITTTIDANGQNWASWPVLLSKTVTPLSNNSKFIIQFQTNITSFSGTGGAQFAICSNRSGTLDISFPTSGRDSTIESMALWHSGTSFSNNWTPINIFGIVYNNSLSSFTIDARFASENGSSVSAIHPRYGPAFMIITEIAI